jgi:hypothetical protein
MKVADYRNAIDHLNRKINVDLQACSGILEVAQWFTITVKVRDALVAAECKTAKPADVVGAERALENSLGSLRKIHGKLENSGCSFDANGMVGIPQSALEA